MPPIPDTNAYMILGYALTLIILGGFVVYLTWKQRRLSAERNELEALDREGKK